MSIILFFFFFSSRRRHTRLVSDWSSDVCSSDLQKQPPAKIAVARSAGRASAMSEAPSQTARLKKTRDLKNDLLGRLGERSEERRVGKECRSRWSPDQEKKKEYRWREGSRATQVN